MPSVLQNWVEGLSFMQQSVLISAIRGPDTLRKDHNSKLLMRWLRRCVLYSAFETYRNGTPTTLNTPFTPGGGSFTGPVEGIDAVFTEYLRNVDELPHHFHLHFMHAAEIIGYKHPLLWTRSWWHRAYSRIVNDMHLNLETETEMDDRLTGDEVTWRAWEEVTAL